MEEREIIHKYLKEYPGISDKQIAIAIKEKYPGKFPCRLDSLRRRLCVERHELGISVRKDMNDFYIELEKSFEEFPDESFIVRASRLQLKFNVYDVGYLQNLISDYVHWNRKAKHTSIRCDDKLCIVPFCCLN